MDRAFPCVKGEHFYPSESEGDPILVGTPAWYDWLEHHAAFTFVDAAGTFTARKSIRRTNGSNWKAYRRRQGKLSRIDLGPSHVLTLEWLQAAALAFAGEHVSGKPPDVSKMPSAASMLPSSRIALTADLSLSLLQTKLSRPRSRSDLIARVRLLERLNAGLSGTLTLISAPAGFGKTTLLAQWVQALDRPSAWLSLDEHDNELAVFVRSLTAALQSVLPDAVQATASLLRASLWPAVQEVATLLLNELADVPQDVMLVLDDYHFIRNSQVHSLLERLIEGLPPHVHLVLATRSDPPLPLVKWLAQGHLNQLRRADLRFTLQETQAFLAGVLSQEAAHESALALEERTQGWIALVRLAALSLGSISDHAAFLQRLAHFPDRDMSRYLLEEVLDQLAPAVQELLVRTSMLEQFCAQLCIATLGSDLSYEQVQSTLDWLERSNLFLVPLDERQGWYRFHHLFKPLLEQRLQAHSSPAELAMMHRRASVWFAQQGLLEEAILHAVAAGDAPGAAHLVEAHFLWAFEQEQQGQLERWLRLLPEHQIQDHPCLLVARVWIVQARGQLQALPPLLRRAEQLLATSDSSASDLDNPQSRVVRALIAIGWSMVQYFTGQAQASLESARSALRWLGPGEGYVAGHALMFLALAQQASGQEDVALAALQQALKDQAASRTDTARLLFAQALVYVGAGKLHQVEQTVRHLLRLAQEADLALIQGWAHWLLGYVHYEWNQLDAAVYHFSTVVANQHHAHVWPLRDALCGLALAYHAQGLDTRAHETAGALLEFEQNQHNLQELLVGYAFCGQLALLQNEVEKASRWLELAGDQAVLGPMPFFEDPPITRAWMLLAKGDEGSVAHGQALLTHLLQHVQAIHNTRKTINVLVLQAWAYQLQGCEAHALAVLEHALALARPGGFIRTFADVRPLVKLLQELHKRSKARQQVDPPLDSFLQRLLAAMSQPQTNAVSTQELMKQEGLEPLTERELQILRLLEKDLTNKQIACELVLTPGTVKVHTTNIYRKLSVTNRRAAVTLAKALGLLPAG